MWRESNVRVTHRDNWVLSANEIFFVLHGGDQIPFSDNNFFWGRSFHESVRWMPRLRADFDFIAGEGMFIEIQPLSIKEFTSCRFLQKKKNSFFPLEVKFICHSVNNYIAWSKSTILSEKKYIHIETFHLYLISFPSCRNKCNYSVFSLCAWLLSFSRPGCVETCPKLCEHFHMGRCTQPRASTPKHKAQLILLEFYGS